MSNRNPYFKMHEKATADAQLFNNATNEFVSQFGIDVLYLPKKLQNSDYVFGEDPTSIFDTTFDITVYIENFSAFEGQNDLFGKFGLQVDDTMSLVIQQDQFVNDVGTPPSPMDLIYFPLNRGLFEITFVEDEEGFYQFGRQMVYNMKCRLFEYSHEDIITGNTDIDEINEWSNDTDDEELQIKSEIDEILNFDEKHIFDNL